MRKFSTLSPDSEVFSSKPWPLPPTSTLALRLGVWTPTLTRALPAGDLLLLSGALPLFSLLLLLLLPGLLGGPGLRLVPDQRHLPPAPERGPLRGRQGRRVPAGAGACPLPALRGTSRLSRLHPGACQATRGGLEMQAAKSGDWERGRPPWSWHGHPRGPPGCSGRRQVGLWSLIYS